MFYHVLIVTEAYHLSINKFVGLKTQNETCVHSVYTISIWLE